MIEIKNFLNTPSVFQGVKKLVEENAELGKQMEEGRKQRAKALREEIARNMPPAEGFHLVCRQVDLVPEIVRDIAFGLKQEFPNIALILGSVVDGKPLLTVALGDEAVGRGLHAGNIVREAAKEIGGGGGGQPFFATAGGKNAAGIEAAMLRAKKLVEEKL